MRAVAVAGVLAASVVALAGCGASTLSTGQLQQDAASFCALASSRAERIAAPGMPADGASYLSRGEAVLAPELTALRSLSPPSGLAQAYHAALAALSEQVDLVGAAVERLRHGADPVAEIRALEQRLQPIEADADSAWRTLQIPACREQ